MSFAALRRALMERLARGESRSFARAELRGLPMDEASRMARAREMGFDTEAPLYHGTASDLESLRPGRRGGPVYLTDDPSIADIYANAAQSRWPGMNNANPNVLPVMIRRQNPLVISDRGPNGDHGWLSDNLAQALELPANTPRVRLNKEALARGYDSIEVRDMLDLGGEQTQILMLDPANIRSRFAAFDPSRSNRRDILAGLAVAAPVGGLTLREALQDRIGQT